MLLVALALAPACARAASAPTATPTAPTASAAGSFGNAMLRALNRVRARHHLPHVRADRRMSGGASAHSRDMARRGYFAHGPWTTRVQQASGRARNVGEVIGWLQRSGPRSEASQMVRAWLNSPSHRAVMLSGGFRRVGIGRANGSFGGRGVALYTVDFASAR